MPMSRPHPRIALTIFSAITSGIMSAIVCLAVVYEANGWSNMFAGQWFDGWIFAWPIAFASLLLVGPFVRKTVFRLCGCG